MHDLQVFTANGWTTVTPDFDTFWQAYDLAHSQRDLCDDDYGYELLGAGWRVVATNVDSAIPYEPVVSRE